MPMTTNGFFARRFHFGVVVVIAVSGLPNQQRLLTAQGARFDARDQVIAKLRAAQQEYLNEVSLKDENRVLAD